MFFGDEMLTTPLAKAFSANAAGSFSTGPFVRKINPNSLPDGFFLNGIGRASDRISFIPVCNGNAGAQFSVRLICWNRIGVDPLAVWIGVPVLEVLCTASIVTGENPDYLVADSDRFCDTISLTAGNLGVEGAIYAIGPDLPAMVVCEWPAARMFSFDVDTQENMTMNAFWSLCSEGD